jgi:ABC-type sugar transport system ATPase subunit
MKTTIIESGKIYSLFGKSGCGKLATLQYIRQKKF